MPEEKKVEVLESDKLSYDGELTLEALATLDTYIKTCCNTSATAQRLHKGYLQVRKYLRQPYVREIFQLKLMQKGITPDKIADVVKAGIDAKDKEGNDDWVAKHRFTQLACEIYEVLKYQAKVDSNNLINIQVNNIKQVLEYANRNAGKDRLPAGAEGTGSLEK